MKYAEISVSFYLLVLVYYFLRRIIKNLLPEQEDPLKLFFMATLSRPDNEELRNPRNSYFSDMEDSLVKSLATDSGLNIIAASCVFPFPLFVVSMQTFRRIQIISAISNVIGSENLYSSQQPLCSLKIVNIYSEFKRVLKVNYSALNLHESYD